MAEIHSMREAVAFLKYGGYGSAAVRLDFKLFVAPMKMSMYSTNLVCSSVSLCPVFVREINVSVDGMAWPVFRATRAFNTELEYHITIWKCM